jgi:hypothetical protein
VYNTLNGMDGYPGERAHPKQWLAMFSMESGLYYNDIYTAKSDHGFNLSAGARRSSVEPVFQTPARPVSI